MYEIRENRRRLKDGTEITTYARDIYIIGYAEKSKYQQLSFRGYRC